MMPCSPAMAFCRTVGHASLHTACRIGPSVTVRSKRWGEPVAISRSARGPPPSTDDNRMPGPDGRSESHLHVGSRIHVDAVDEPDAVRMRLHDQRTGPDAVAEEPHAPHQVAVGHARG